jgi:two-component system phosphate regulon sensor histidine kinase PhoR
VANVSHELRTPVSVIQANAETLLGGALSDEKSAPLFLAAIMRNARRLGQLITDLLDLAQLESGNYRIKVKRLELGTLLDNVLESLSDKADSKGMELISKWKPNQTAWMDERAFTQVFSNFLDNAIKYTPEGGRIVINSQVDGAIVRIQVEDNGPGIEPRHHSRLFERFYRVDTGRSRELGGTGLGLAIVKHLALSMGGRVGVESIEPHGSLFWLELPTGDEPYTALAQKEE